MATTTTAMQTLTPTLMGAMAIPPARLTATATAEPIPPLVQAELAPPSALLAPQAVAPPPEISLDAEAGTEGVGNVSSVGSSLLDEACII